MQKLNNTYITQRLRTGTCALCFFTDRLALAAVGPAWNHSDEARTWLGCRSLCIASMMIRPHSLLIYSENFLGSCSPLRFQVLDSTCSSLLLAAAIPNLLLFLALDFFSSYDKTLISIIQLTTSYNPRRTILRKCAATK